MEVRITLGVTDCGGRQCDEFRRLARRQVAQENDRRRPLLDVRAQSTKPLGDSRNVRLEPLPPRPKRIRPCARRFTQQFGGAPAAPASAPSQTSTGIQWSLEP